MDMDQGRPVQELFMKEALAEAGRAGAEGEVPIGAVAVRDGEIIAREHNRTIQMNDPTAHAEILLLRKTAKLIGNYRLAGVTVFVTVEPCPMCAGALIQGRVEKLVFGTPDPKGGGVISKFRVLEPGLMNHSIPYEAGVLGRECREIIQLFFHDRR